MRPKKGIVRQFLGCVLISLGVLNGALALKDGSAPDIFIYLLAGTGIVILISGLAASRRP